MEGWGEMEEGWRKGPWTTEEDRLLIEYVNLHGGGRWNSVSTLTGLRRNGKSCRLRWVNYLRPDLKKGQITPDEEKIILELHARWGNRWSTIARSLPGRTDNEIKNYWRTHFKNKEKVLSNNSKKSKTLHMRRQQYQQQQQQQLNQVDAQRILYLLDGSISQTKEETATVNPSIAPDDQGLFYSVMRSNTSTPDAAHEDDFLWDGLWNLDDHVPGNLSAICATSRASMHNFGAPFY